MNGKSASIYLFNAHFAVIYFRGTCQEIEGLDCVCYWMHKWPRAEHNAIVPWPPIK